MVCIEINLFGVFIHYKNGGFSMKQVWKAAVCAVLAAGVLGLVGCGGAADKKAPAASSQQKSVVQAIKDKGQLVVGTSSGFPPYEFWDKAGMGQVAGIDIELAHKVADKLGVKMVVQDMKFANLQQELAKGKLDLIVAALDPSRERKSELLFSEPYLKSPQILVVKKDQAGQYKTMADFKGKKIGAQRDTLQADLAKKVPDASVEVYDKVEDVFRALDDGKIDGIVFEEVSSKPYIMVHPDITSSGVVFENVNSSSAVAARKGDDELIKVVNEVIEENKDQMDGWVEKYSELAVDNAKKK